MRLYANQLQQHLSQQLLPCYLLVGDEPLQLQEGLDAIRQQAKQAGFLEREFHAVDTAFQWQKLQSDSANLSLFAEKKLIELHIPNGKPGRAGSAMISDFVQNLADDMMLLVRCDQWTAANDKSKWVKTIDQHGVVMRVYQPKTEQMPNWIEQRCRSIGLKVDRDAIALLSMRLEGNLLAAAQELEKLKMRFAEQPINGKQIAGLVADNARFDVFRLTDSLIEGNGLKSIRILRSLQKNDLSPVIIHWALEKETRMLCEFAHLRQHQRNVSTADYRRYGIWQNRQAAIQKCLNQHSLQHFERALTELSKLDQIIKGRHFGNPWQTTEQWLTKFCLHR